METAGKFQHLFAAARRWQVFRLRETRQRSPDDQGQSDGAPANSARPRCEPCGAPRPPCPTARFSSVWPIAFAATTPATRNAGPTRVSAALGENSKATLRRRCAFFLGGKVESGMTFVLRMRSNTNCAQRHPGARASRPLKRPNPERASACHLMPRSWAAPGLVGHARLSAGGPPALQMLLARTAARQLIPVSITPSYLETSEFSDLKICLSNPRSRLQITTDT